MVSGTATRLLGVLMHDYGEEFELRHLTARGERDVWLAYERPRVRGEGAITADSATQLRGLIEERRAARAAGSVAALGHLVRVQLDDTEGIHVAAQLPPLADEPVPVEVLYRGQWCVIEFRARP